MDNLNSVLVEGNLTRDPEVLHITENIAATRFCIGVSRHYLNREKEFVSESSFFNVITWGKTAENCAKYLKKGRGVRVLGRLRQERWQGKDNQMRERIVIAAQHVEFQPEKKNSSKALPDKWPDEKIDIPSEIEMPFPTENEDELNPIQEQRALEADRNNPPKM